MIRKMTLYSKLKSLMASAVTSCILALSPISAYAEYTYSFSFSPNGNDVNIASSYISFSGMFVGGAPGTTFTPSNVSGTGFSNTGTFSFTGDAIGTIGPANSNVSFITNTYPSLSFYSGTNSANTPYSQSGGAYLTGEMRGTTLGDFITTLVSSPGSGGSGGGNGGSGSGGAPSPEINSGVGMLLAGAAFVFLRRRRGSRHEATTA